MQEPKPFGIVNFKTIKKQPMPRDPQACEKLVKSTPDSISLRLPFAEASLNIPAAGALRFAKQSPSSENYFKNRCDIWLQSQVNSQLLNLDQIAQFRERLNAGDCLAFLEKLYSQEKSPSASSQGDSENADELVIQSVSPGGRFRVEVMAIGGDSFAECMVQEE